MRTPIKKSQHTFDNRYVSAGRRVEKDLPIDVRPQHPAIQIARAPPDQECVMTRIDEIRPDLKRLHPAASLLQSRQQRQGDSGLAHPAMGTGDDESGIVHRSSSGSISITD